jgi:hypothetical protein
VKKQFETASLHGQIPPLFNSLHSASFRFIPLHSASLHLGIPVGTGKIGDPARSLQLLVGTFFLIPRAIPEADLLLPLTSHFFCASTLKKCLKCR